MTTQQRLCVECHNLKEKKQDERKRERKSTVKESFGKYRGRKRKINIMVIWLRFIIGFVFANVPTKQAHTIWYARSHVQKITLQIWAKKITQNWLLSQSWNIFHPLIYILSLTNWTFLLWNALFMIGSTLWTYKLVYYIYTYRNK